MRIIGLMNIFFEFMPVVSSQPGTGSNPYKALFIRQDTAHGWKVVRLSGRFVYSNNVRLEGGEKAGKLYDKCYA